jgi:integrase
VRSYQLFLSETGASPPTINHVVTALRFLFQVTLHRPEVMHQIPFVPEPRKLPVVLSPDEVARLLEAAPNLKSKAALSVAYGTGLRASEVVTLKVSDIDSTRMVIRTATKRMVGFVTTATHLGTQMPSVGAIHLICLGEN